MLVVAGASFSWVDREKEKEVPRGREKLKVLLWLASAWQNSRHLAAKPELVTSAVDILVVILNQKKFHRRDIHSPGVSQSRCLSVYYCDLCSAFSAVYFCDMCSAFSAVYYCDLCSAFSAVYYCDMCSAFSAVYYCDL